jgi:D-alanyl-D-alanine carboxypeptidase/D-alanyl-D-alanine-endopeptidase (penicillin-binding protein 4)
VRRFHENPLLDQPTEYTPLAYRADIVYNLEVRRRTALLAILSVLVFFLVSLPADAAARRRHVPRKAKLAKPAEPPAGSLAEALERAARRPPARLDGLSIEIAEVATGERVFSRNPDAPETIASVTKLFSTAAALHFLGPDYKFKTTFWRRGEITDGVLTGSLLVVGGGDPNISGRFYHDDYNAVFDKWAEGLKAAGVTRVNGDLVLNDSFFDSILRNPEWPSGQEAKWYQAPVSALAYNDGVVLVGIRPGTRAGGPAAVSIEPQTGTLRAISSARTVGRRGNVRLAVRRADGSNAVTISGTVPMRSVWWSTPIAVEDPTGFFGGALKNRLKAAGIELSGQVVRKDVKPDAAWALIAETDSDLMATLAVINKRSQGFYAEQTFKTLAAEKAGKGTWENALSLEKQFLAALALDPTRYNLHDGSGLSPQNRVSAADIVSFLRAMETHPNGAAWKVTLATPGDPESTLRHRLHDPVVRDRVAAKTGSIRGVSTLAGYATGLSGKTYVFAILLNGPGVWDGGGHAFQDRLLQALIHNG